MLKIDRSQQTLSSLKKPTLTQANILERYDLQEFIFNSPDEFFSEVNEEIFIVGKEISPSDTVQDRIDLLGIDKEGSIIIIELKRGTNKLQMLQSISYAGMISGWDHSDFEQYLSDEKWDQLLEFLNVGFEEINRQQKIVLIAEGYDYALLAGAEWLTEYFGVNIKCITVALASDEGTQTEYLACTSIYPQPVLAEQSISRRKNQSISTPLKWINWEDALSNLENISLKSFIEKELKTDRERYLRKRMIIFRANGRRRWNLSCRIKYGYVWQIGRFENDIEFWKSGLTDSESVGAVKRGESVKFLLHSDNDLEFFERAINSSKNSLTWLDE